MTSPASVKRLYKLGPVLPHVKRAAEHVGTLFGIESVLGWRASAKDKMGHPAGLALDYMCDLATGRRLNAYLLANADALGIKYTIHEQTYFVPGKAPEPMEDRGSPTQNHLDHVHAQFKATGGAGDLPDLPAGTYGGDGGAAPSTFTGWAGDLLALGIKAGAVGAALALVVTGVRSTVK